MLQSLISLRVLPARLGSSSVHKRSFILSGLFTAFVYPSWNLYRTAGAAAACPPAAHPRFTAQSALGNHAQSHSNSGPVPPPQLTPALSIASMNALPWNMIACALKAGGYYRGSEQACDKCCWPEDRGDRRFMGGNSGRGGKGVHACNLVGCGLRLPALLGLLALVAQRVQPAQLLLRATLLCACTISCHLETTHCPMRAVCSDDCAQEFPVRTLQGKPPQS